MPVAEVVATLTRYARLIAAPVRTATTVHTLRAAPQGFAIHANDDLLYARAVVLATGACNLPVIPAVDGGVPRRSRHSPRSPIAIPGSFPTAGHWLSARQPPESSSPSKSTGPAAR